MTRLEEESLDGMRAKLVEAERLAYIGEKRS
jgi:dsRNA-specific ribonuclease